LDLEELARAAERLPPGAPVKFVRADATTYRFESAAFDLLFSRFGVMFFAEPACAFANLRAEHVIAADATLDAMQREIEQKTIMALWRRQPIAVDLREIVGAMRVSNDLERIGDHAKHIGKRAVALDRDRYPQTFARGVEHMADLVLILLKQRDHRSTPDRVGYAPVRRVLDGW
jgi:hypothetical protein